MSQDKRLEHIKQQIIQLIQKYESEKKQNQLLNETNQQLEKDIQALQSELKKVQEENNQLKVVAEEKPVFKSGGFIDKERGRYLDYIEKDIDWLVNL